MKVFATLATVLGVAYAAPNAQIMQPIQKVQMGSVQSGLQQQSVMPNMRLSAQSYQTGPTQYHLQDEFGNFEYAYANQDSQKSEKGNDMSVRGRYAYVMSDGVLRRVEYIANNNGFHILQDNADSSKAQQRIKRSVEPDLIQTRMTSIMDSSSLRDNSMVNPNMYNLMGRDMSSNNMMQRLQMNDMSSKRNMYNMLDSSSNMMGQDMMGRNMVNENMMGHTMMNKNMMGQNMRKENLIGQNMMNNMMGHNMYSDRMEQEMSPNMMEQEMSSDMMNRNTMGQDMHNMMGRNMMSDNVYSNMMGRDMSTNMRGNRMNAFGNDMNSMPLRQSNTMSQRMQIEQIPQLTAASKQFF